MTKNNGTKRSETQALAVIVVLLFLALTLAACSSLGGLIGHPSEAAVRATWTPESHPTDLPFQVETEPISYFGEGPVVAIFGSQSANDDSPLRAVNITTDDFYDVSVLEPGPSKNWSRPIIAEDKDLFFQIGHILYALSPGGAVASVELSFEDQDPVFCNWSWKGKLVCLNDLMTVGFLVDQDLNVVALPLSAPAVDDSVDYYRPYRVGENTMRILRIQTERSGGQLVIYYRDLDLESQTVTEQQNSIDFDFNRTVTMTYTYHSDERVITYTQSAEPPDVLGMTDDGEIVYLLSDLVYTSNEGRTSTTPLIEMYGQQEYGPVQLEVPINFRYPRKEKLFYHNHLITSWSHMMTGSYNPTWPGVYDLETGELLFDSTNTVGDNRDFAAILPFGENWLVKGDYGVGYINEHGYPLNIYYFDDFDFEIISDGGYYTVTQPMEP